ncbi:hypothetical protein O3M35_003491 [Rhynocoris fuscipes]|uniref:Uncharacterized protein n=1 Tax=Rhynocoris fuscipes TaxID=488301 RepID=A0AAW1CJ40_9HEMI
MRMTIVILYYGPYDFHGRIKYRYIRLKGLIKLLTSAKIPLKLKRFQFWDRLNVEIEGQMVYRCRLSNMEFDSDGNDYTSVTAFEIIRDAYYSVLKYYSRKDEDCILYPKYTGTKFFPVSFDSFYLESFCRYVRKPYIIFRKKTSESEHEEDRNSIEVTDY